MNPLPSSHTDRACERFLAQLGTATAVDPVDLAGWLRDNREWLRDAFLESGESDQHSEVEYCLGIWLRFEFKRREALAALAQKSRPAPSPAAEPRLTRAPSQSSAPGRAGTLFPRRFLRRSVWRAAGCPVVGGRMKIRLSCTGYVDRRTEDLHARHDSIERKRFEQRVKRNAKERERLERFARAQALIECGEISILRRQAD